MSGGVVEEKEEKASFANKKLFTQYVYWVSGLTLIIAICSLFLSVKSALIVLAGGAIYGGVSFLLRNDPPRAIAVALFCGVIFQVINLDIHRDIPNIGVVWFLAVPCFASFTGSVRLIVFLAVATAIGIAITGIRAPVGDPIWSHPLSFPNMFGMLALCTATSYAVHRHRLKREQRLSEALLNVEALAEDLARTNESLKKSEKSKSRLLETMSHELRTPMMTIAVAAERLMKSGEDGSSRQMISAIERSARNMTEIMNDVLDMGATHSGLAKVSEKPFDLPEAVKGACESAHIAAPDVVVVLDVKPDFPLIWNGDAARLHQIVLNLIRNALLHSGTRAARVRLEQEPQGGVRLLVEDWGRGIEGKALTELFEPYVRTGASTSGTGLGLAITKDFVALLGGQIDVNSTVGQGTVFTVSLPFAVGGESVVADRYEQPILSDARLVGQEVVKEAVRPWLRYWKIREDIESVHELNCEDLLETGVVFSPDCIAKMVRTQRALDTSTKGTGSAGKTCLVVEDEVLLTDLLCQYLGDSGFDVKSATDGTSAMSLLAEQDFDVLVVDMNMPGQHDGLEIIKSVVSNTDRPVICAISGLDTFREPALQSGADLFFRKPFSLAGFLQQLEAKMNRSEAD